MEVRRWEYAVFERGPARLSGAWLNTMGAEGWELVSVVAIFNGRGWSEQQTYYFKRPKGWTDGS